MGGRGSGRRLRPDREDGRVAFILAALATGTTRRAAAAAGGIHRDTFYAWLHHRPFFAQAVAKAEADAVVIAVARVTKAAEAGSWRAAAWLLERRWPDEWGRPG